MAEETKEFADVLAARLVLCMRQTDSLRANEVIDYYRSARPYDSGRSRLRLAQALIELIEANVIISLDALKAKKCGVPGEPRPYYFIPISLAMKWAICHQLNWPVGDFELFVDALEDLATDDCRVLRDA